MARYYGSEVLRNKSLQKGINFELKKLTPAVRSEALDQLSTKIRPNKKYRTDRKDLDGRSIQLFEKVDDNLTDPKKIPKNINEIWPNIHGNKHKYLDMGEHWGNSVLPLD